MESLIRPTIASDHGTGLDRYGHRVRDGVGTPTRPDHTARWRRVGEPAMPRDHALRHRMPRPAVRRARPRRTRDGVSLAATTRDPLPQVGHARAPDAAIWSGWCRPNRVSQSAFGHRGLGAPAAGDAAATGVARTNLSKALRFSALLDGLDAEATGYPGGSLSDQLAIAAKLIGSQTGVRVILVRLVRLRYPFGQRGTHDGLLVRSTFDRGVSGRPRPSRPHRFDARGHDERVRPASTRERQRHDHGRASTALLWGPVTPAYTATRCH